MVVSMETGQNKIYKKKIAYLAPLLLMCAANLVLNI